MARRFQRFITTFIFAAGLALAGCAVTEAPPQFPPAFGSFPFNGGRTQAVSVNPRNADEVIIATQFGGLWKTTNRGDRWRHLRGLLTVFAADVQYGNDGRTVVATLRNDTQTTNGGGIYVSRDGGDTWARPATGVIPSDAVSDLRGGGWGISVSPDAPRTWYVGTTFGVARSRDNGASWAHVKVETPPPGTGRTNDYAVNSIVALRGGVVLAATDLAVYRSDDEGDSWRRIKSGSFSAYNHWTGFNRLDRDRSGRNAYWAEMSSDSNGRPVYDGLHYYESGPDRWTRIPLPSGGGSRGPFVRVTDLPRSVRAFDFLGISGDWELIWYSQGTRFLATIGESPEDIRNLSAADWIVYGRDDGVHDDMGDLGAAGIAGDVGPPVILGSDGGVFRPAGGIDVWESAAPGGSGMNSLQITDIAGTNVADGGAFRTDLYIATQDNAVWGSSDGGGSFTESDCCEGFHIEAPFAANAGDDVTVAYGTAGSGPGKRMADPGLTERRDVPTAIPGGSISNFAEAFYLGPNRWLRNRWSVVPARGATTCSPGPCSPPEIYTSINDGDLWRKRFTLNLNRFGVIQRTNIHLGSANVSAYLPVGSGAANPDGSEQIGLVRLNNLFAQFAPGAGSSAISTIGTADVITLPGGGSLGRRATEFDWQAVFGVHPRDARFIIAPDYVNGDVKVTRDGGANWETDRRLTIAASQNGRLQLTGRDSYMQVTHISFDPYDDAKIFVGTRDAGVICSRDGGATWRMIRKTDVFATSPASSSVPTGRCGSRPTAAGSGRSNRRGRPADPARTGSRNSSRSRAACRTRRRGFRAV